MNIASRLENELKRLNALFTSRAQADSFLITLGILIVFFETVAFAVLSPSHLGPQIYLKNLAFGLFFQLTLGLLQISGWRLSRSLLALFCLLILVSALPTTLCAYGVYLVDAIALILCQRKLNLRHLLKRESIYLLFASALLFALFILQSTQETVSGPLGIEQFRQFTLNPDSLFHSAIAAMIKDFRTISVGLNGLNRVHYHALSHALYGLSSHILNTPVNEVYAFTNFIVYAPLLIMCWLHFLTSLTATKGGQLATALFVFIGVVMLQFFGRHFLSAFYSESYLVSLIFLPGALCALNSILQNNFLFSKWDWLALWFYLPLITLAKISTGFILFAAVLYVVFVRSGLPWLRRFILCAMTVLAWAPGYFGARTIPIPRLEMKWQWGWYQEQMHNKLFLTFLVEQFFFALIFLPFLLYRPLRAAIAQSYAIWIEILLIGAAIGVAAAQLTIDSSGGYFIDVHMYLALPVLLLALTDCDIRGRFSAAINVWSSRAYQFVIIVIIVSGLYSLVKLLPNFIRDFSRDRSLVLQHLDYHNPYSALFQHIRDDHEERYMVYIPKTEKYFWENTDDTYTRWAKHQCIKMPFYLPIATGKPALFGLPDPARNCYTFHRGYESYSEQEYRDSAALNYDDDALCRAVLAKGFDGVYRVTLAAGVVKQRCRN